MWYLNDIQGNEVFLRRAESDPGEYEMNITVHGSVSSALRVSPHNLQRLWEVIGVELGHRQP